MRFYYLDNLRALLMILGVVLHTCAAFSPSAYWLVSSHQSIAWVDPINQYIHIFRMPLFFMISGFFAVMIIQKQSIPNFCTEKVKRLLIPFVSVFILINIPQYFLLHSLNEQASTGNSIPLTGHLWFLNPH